MALDFTADGVVGARPDAVRAVVGDLGTYPQWLGIVRRAESAGPDAWTVEIGARVGPFTRAKRLRMVRTGPLRFERAEEDGRPHAAWVLAGGVEPAASEGDSEGERSRVQMTLHYAGGVALPGLDLVLKAEVRRALPRLERLASNRQTQGE
jgi:hypothetical protein